jgi:hypothetical protein
MCCLSPVSAPECQLFSSYVHVGLLGKDAEMRASVDTLYFLEHSIGLHSWVYWSSLSWLETSFLIRPHRWNLIFLFSLSEQLATLRYVLYSKTLSLMITRKSPVGNPLKLRCDPGVGTLAIISCSTSSPEQLQRHQSFIAWYKVNCGIIVGASRSKLVADQVVGVQDEFRTFFFKWSMLLIHCMEGIQHIFMPCWTVREMDCCCWVVEWSIAPKVMGGGMINVFLLWRGSKWGSKPCGTVGIVWLEKRGQLLTTYDLQTQLWYGLSLKYSCFQLNTNYLEFVSTAKREQSVSDWKIALSPVLDVYNSLTWTPTKTELPGLSFLPIRLTPASLSWRSVVLE